VDKQLATIDMQIGFKMNSTQIEMTASKTDSIGNSKLMSFGLADQSFKIIKQRNDISINMFGITIGTYNHFEQIYNFMMKTKNTALKVVENVKNTVDQDMYVQQVK